MKIKHFFTSFLTLAVISTSLLCSDGVDRHKKFSPNTFFLFDEPIKGCGYSVLPKDSEGGADGTLEYRWAQKHIVALVKICAYETEKELGETNHPLLIFDGCAENGDTPVDWEPKPAGRHPGGSHDGGINIDLGYYLTSTEGKVFNPDYSACSNHFEASENGTLKDSWICNEIADKLDVDRMSYFYLKMLLINRDLFSKELLSQIGADFFVKKAVVEKLSEWAKNNKYGATNEIVQDFDRIATCDEFEGWAKSHHHHTHLRLNDVEIYGKLNPAFETLYRIEKDIDFKLLKTQENRNEVLRIRLLSTGLERAVEAELLSEQKVKNLRFRIGEGDWIEPPKNSKEQKVFFDIPEKIFTERLPITITAQYANSKGLLETIKKEIILPKQDPRLYISFDPEQVKATISEDKNALSVKLDYPQIYNHLITTIFYEIETESGIEKIEPSAFQRDLLISLKDKKQVLISACFILCGRKTIKIPIYVKTRMGD